MMRLEKSLENVSQQGRGKPEWMMSPRMNLQKQIHIWDSQNTPCPKGLFERQCSWDNISRLISSGIKYIGHHELRRPHTCQFRSSIFFSKEKWVCQNSGLTTWFCNPLSASQGGWVNKHFPKPQSTPPVITSLLSCAQWQIPPTTGFAMT